MKSLKSIIKYARLPSEYQEVEYIQSTGTQYVDTGLYGSENTKVDLDFAFYADNDRIGSGRIFGTRDTGNVNACVIGTQVGTVSTSESYFAQIDNASFSGDAINVAFSRTNVIFDKTGLKINGVYSRTFSNVSSFNTTGTLILFGFYNSNTETKSDAVKGNMRVYYCKIYENDVLVRDYLPCYRKADNVIGLYDLVNDVFYTNAGSGVFIKGNDVNKFIQSIGSCLKYIRPESGLPAEYQEVEYIQSSGYQYIDTGVNLSSSDTIKCKFELTATPTSYAEGVFGTMEYKAGGNLFFVLLMRTPNLARVGTSSNQVTSTNVATNTVYDTSLSNGTYIENGTTYTFTPHDGFTFNISCYVFKRNQASMEPIKGKIYSFEIVGKFKGIPCYRKSDNVIGMYDTISETFFTNAGTGDFSKGADKQSIVTLKSIDEEIILSKGLPSAYQEVEYIEGTGTQYIQTSISIKDTDRLEFDIMPTHTNNTYEEVLGTDWTGSLATNITFYMWSGLTHYFSPLGATLSSWQRDTLYHIEFLDKLNRIVRNDTVLATLSPSSTGVTSDNLNIFGLDSGHRFVGRLYTLTIIDSNDTIIHQIVPCYRKADNEVGLYDLVNNVFYANAGTGTFLKGRSIIN